MHLILDQHVQDIFYIFIKSCNDFTLKKETLRSLQQFAYYSSLGFQIALSIVIGLALGVYLDRKFNLTPWLTLIGLGLGIAAGFKNIGLAIKKSRKL